MGEAQVVERTFRAALLGRQYERLTSRVLSEIGLK
jgi:hypothetical protein